MSRTVNYKLRQLRGWIRIRWHRLKSTITLEKHRWYYRVVIFERYQKLVNRVARLVLLTTVVASFTTIPMPWATIVSLGLIGAEQVLEHIVFAYRTFILVPFPSFELWRRANFNVASFGYPESESAPALVGMGFVGDGKAAAEVWAYIRGWNYDQDEDFGDGNVVVTIVLHEKYDAYAVFIYPSLNRPSIQALQKDIESKANQAKRHQMHIGQMIMIKVFKYSGGSFEDFARHYKDGQKYRFEAMFVKGTQPFSISGAKPMWKDRLRILKYEELTPKDVEYHSAKYGIDWVDKTITGPTTYRMDPE